MRISDLLFSAGGMDDPEFKSMMYLKRVDLVRLQKDGNQKEIRSLSLKSILADSKSSDNLFLQDGDLVRVYNVQTFKEIKPVFIRGVVKNPGEYEIKYNMNIKDLIIEAGGIPSNYNYFKIELSRRQNNDLNSVKNYKITDYYFNNDLEEIYSFDKASGLLKPYDIVSVYIENGRNDELNNSITINGSVKFEGDYIVINDEERITDVLKRAGGLLNSANPNASQFIRNDKLIFFDLDWIIKYPNSKKNIVVLPGDKIFVGEKSFLVTIEGEVKNQGNYQYIKGKKMDDYIKDAGGFTKNASKFQSFIINPDDKPNQ